MQSDLSAFSEIEDALQKLGNVPVVLLIIDPGHTKERIEETVLHRKDNWKKGAPGNPDEKAAYYAKQQAILISLIAQSHLRSIVIHTTNKAWDENVETIMQSLM